MGSGGRVSRESMKSKKLIYNVVFDTSALHGYPFNTELMEKLEGLVAKTNVKINLYLPSTVDQELKQHFLNDFATKVGTYNTSLKNLKKNYDFDIELLKHSEEEKDALVKKLFDNGIFTVLPIEYDKVDLKALVSKAVKYELPFQKTHEKGFKDSIIFECVKQNQQNLSKSAVMAVVVNDIALREHIGNSLTDIKIHDSLPAYTSSLAMRLFEIDSKTARDMIDRAEDFFNVEFPAPVLKEKIMKEHDHLIIHPQLENIGYSAFIDTNESYIYKPLGKGKINVARPVFEGRKDLVFSFNTTVLYKQNFQKIIQNSASLWGAHSPLTQEYVLDFKVSWKAVYSDVGNFENGTIESIEYVDTRDYGNYSRASLATLSSNETTLGQGTVPSPAPPEDEDDI